MVIRHRSPKSSDTTPLASPAEHESKTYVFPSTVNNATALEEPCRVGDPPPAYDESSEDNASLRYSEPVVIDVGQSPESRYAWRVRGSSLVLTALEGTVAVKRGLYTYEDLRVATVVPSTDRRSPTRAAAMFDNIKYNKVSPGVVEHAPKLGTGVRSVIGLSLQAPMMVTMQLSNGFHHLPSVYGDRVREHEKVTCIKSGLHAAGKGLGLGLWDGISGLITQPVNGAKEGGFIGGLVGFGKGIGGVALKPAAGAVGVPGNLLKGIYKEVRNTSTATGPPNEIVAAQIVQGLRQWDATTDTDREAIFETIKARLQDRGMIGT